MQKIIPYGHHFIDNNDIQEIVKVLKSDWITQGPVIIEFEKSLAKYVHAKYCVAVSSGTAALETAYFAAGLSKDSEIIVSPLTFAATTNAALWFGAKVIFADIDEHTGNVNPNEVEKKISKKTKAIVAVDYAGLPCDLSKLQKIAKKNKILLIEDAAHALGASIKWEKIGGISDMTVFSFHPVKSITTGEGGAITTNNKVFYQKMLLFRNHGMVKNLKVKNSLDWYYEIRSLGHNFRMTDIQAALGLSQLKKLDKFLKLRRKIADRYREKLSVDKRLVLPVDTKQTESAWHLFPLRFTGNLEDKRNFIFKELRNAGIGVQVHYIPVYFHPYYMSLGYKKGICPKAEKFFKSEISLPIYPKMKNSQFDYVVKTLKNVIKKYKN